MILKPAAHIDGHMLYLPAFVIEVEILNVSQGRSIDSSQAGTFFHGASIDDLACNQHDSLLLRICTGIFD